MAGTPFIMLDKENTGLPLYRQIYTAIRDSILRGEFESQMRLPATRLLAQQIGVSRMTVINAYEQLFAEGYLEGKTGSGTFVAAHLPEESLQSARIKHGENEITLRDRDNKFSAYGRHLSRISRNVLRNQVETRVVPFQHGLTAMDEFPFEVWAKITQKWQKFPHSKIFDYGDSAGFEPLRKAIAAHLGSARGVSCEAGQVIITNGAQQALDLIARILLVSEDRVWLEDPCYLGARDVFASTGAELVSVPVDSDGFDLNRAIEMSRNARLVYTTPSRQFPIGVTMSLDRRLNLLDWAAKNEAWIVEDDYDSEYRYAGRPLASLQGLDRAGRVIYIGTFSKTIFPGLRLGCLVVPADLADVFTTARALTDQHSPLLEQAVLAEFISEGHFARHVRRMRTLYQKRQHILIDEIEKRLGGMLDVSKADAGMQIVGWLPEGFCDRTISQKATEFGLRAAPVSDYCIDTQPRGGLILGYTAFNEKQIKRGIETLAKVLNGNIHP